MWAAAADVFLCLTVRSHTALFWLCGCLNQSHALPLQQHQDIFALRALLCLHMPNVEIATPAGLLFCC